MFEFDFGLRDKVGTKSRPKLQAEDKKVCVYPPSNNEEMLASVIEYITSDKCDVPITASLLFREYSTQNENFKRFREFIKEEQFLKCLEEVAEAKGISTQTMFTFQKNEVVVCQKDLEVLRLLNREHFYERPKKLPEKPTKELISAKLDRKIVNLQRLKDEMFQEV